MAEELPPLITQTIPFACSNAWSLLTLLSHIYFSYPSIFHLLPLLTPSQGDPFPSVHCSTRHITCTNPHATSHTLSPCSHPHILLLYMPLSCNSLPHHPLTIVVPYFMSRPGLHRRHSHYVYYVSFLFSSRPAYHSVFYCLYPSHCDHLALFSDT